MGGYPHKLFARDTTVVLLVGHILSLGSLVNARAAGTDKFGDIS